MRKPQMQTTAVVARGKLGRDGQKWVKGGGEMRTSIVVPAIKIKKKRIIKR